MTATPSVPGSGTDGAQGPFQKVVALLQDSLGNDYDSDNPLPVGVILQSYAPAETENRNADGNQYLGNVNKDGRWYIQQRSNVGQNTNTIKFSAGTATFSTNWGNRTTLTYDYFNDAF